MKLQISLISLFTTKQHPYNRYVAHFYSQKSFKKYPLS